ncbi:hypothetical protein CDG76_28280 [Nostoc sp. 'Peltigera membranacea cyanobiont' 210A]|uniref:hypothetical protein n=1 Tax=Nostoc sp. 'Peltigera membranacea cyanobiont' 210A TaxID=2014529 RepID=UPI000B958E4E|nr:hypothetical protein [Nostoc sp. 'Peltigera membranacea cyanobiont' 210A]OYD91151.1 hypothetical protein CDG76_28280 [Nostoc sp. 'Peltigera membranacea cyanobiont' 210A]
MTSTSRHSIEESSNPLAKLDYIPLLDTVLEFIKQKPLFKFSPDGNKLRISAYDIAYEIATNPNLCPQSPLTQNIGIKAATVNFKLETEFYSKIQAIRDELRRQLVTACGENQTQSSLDNLCTPLSDFISTQAELPFKYPFNKPYSFTSQRLVIENSLAQERRKGTESVIKAHHLNVKFEGISNFNSRFLESLKSYIDTITRPDSQDWQQLTEILDDISEQKESELTEFQKIVDTESLPRLLRDIKIDYLDYLRIECAKTNLRNSNTQGFECLETLIKRLRLLINYINAPDLDDPDYEVSYLLDKPVNLRTAFSQANAFDILPIIPEYEGMIGESIDKDRGIQEFNLGVRLKLNGSVNSYHENSVVNYYMTELDPTSPRHKDQLKDPAKAKNFKEKVLKIACLYYFVFAVDEEGKIPDKDYDPTPKFKEDVLNKFKVGISDEEVTNLLIKIYGLILNKDVCQVERKLAALRNLLQTFLKKKEILPSFSKRVQLCINKAVLHKNASKIINTRSFLKLDLNQENQANFKAQAREALAYVEVLPPTVNEQSLSSLSVTFTFDDVRYFTDSDKQNFSMKYDITGIKALPVVFYPLAVNPKTNKLENHPIYDKYYKSQTMIGIYYLSKQAREEIFKNTQSPEATIYQQVFTLLSYLCISICREQISLDSEKQEKLFIPIFRFHLQDTQETTEDEVFLNSLSKALAHILRRDCMADAQGLNVKNGKTIDKYKEQNALSSLYALIPKTFELQEGYQAQLDKLAIIVVSSWLSDAVWDEKDKPVRISNIYGEIIVINQVSDTAVKVEPIKTFADNQPHSKISTESEVVRDEISKLYQQGYRHFLYIAKAPYTRSLGITKLESDPDSLFFMSQDVVKYLKAGKPDIKLYPIFMDNYPAINLIEGKADSFYIPDIEELEKLSVDKSQKTRVFLNLFTGRSVDKERTIFNSVVCYSTLLNIYDVGDTKDIIEGLLDKDSPLQKTILQYIALFHFSRYEVNRNIALKLNPYSKLIGDEGIGKISTYTYSVKNVKFNNLAFLTEIRSALYGK